jgi:hypothetical protein
MMVVAPRNRSIPADWRAAWVALWSESQECVHIERLGEFVVKELKEIISGRRGGGYRLVWVSWDETEARAAAAWFQRRRGNR